jgi:hypothetical protein
MNEHLRDRILRKLESLTDERGYQVLDYVEFIESKYAERQNPQGNAFTRFTEAMEDRLRAGKVSAAAIAETMGLLNRAANVLNGAVAAGRSVATDIYTAAQVGTTRSAAPGPASAAAPPTPSAPPISTPPTQASASVNSSSAAHDVKQPGSGQEHL